MTCRFEEKYSRHIYRVYEGDSLVAIGTKAAICNALKIRRTISLNTYAKQKSLMYGRWRVEKEFGRPKKSEKLPPVNRVKEIARRLEYAVEHYDIANTISNKDPEPLFDSLKELGWACTSRKVEADAGNKKARKRYFYVIEACRI